MNKSIIIYLLTIVSTICFAQQDKSDLKMTSNYSSNNEELSDIFQFEGIEYYNFQFSGKELKSKHYQLTVKDIWNGKIVSDTTIVNSSNLPFKVHQKINDTVFKMKVMSKFSENSTLKMSFKFPRFSINKEFKAIKSNDYSLRNIAEESNLELKYNDTFYLLAYILPYEKSDGSKSWCDIGKDGKDIEKWGKKFNIKHYLIFEMRFF